MTRNLSSTRSTRAPEHKNIRAKRKESHMFLVIYLPVQSYSVAVQEQEARPCTGCPLSAQLANAWPVNAVHT